MASSYYRPLAFEGKAPGPQLRSAFHRRSVQRRLNNNLRKREFSLVPRAKYACNSDTESSEPQNLNMHRKALDEQLSRAVLRNEFKAALECLKKGANPLLSDSQGRSLIYNAILKNGARCSHLLIQCLLNHGANVNATDLESGQPLLILAVRANNLKVVETLLEHGHELMPNDSHGRRRKSMSSPSTSSTRMTCDVNVRDRLGRTPLMWSAYKRYNDISAMLIRHGAHPRHDRDRHRSNALQWAGRYCNRTGSEFLWEDEYDGPRLPQATFNHGVFEMGGELFHTLDSPARRKMKRRALCNDIM